MKSTLYLAVLSGAVLAGTLLSSATTAQDQMRFRAMDRNGDGVITRAEWQGNDQSFRQHDRNGDGILSGDELRVAEGTGTVHEFASFDLDGNGRVTTQEWMRAFSQLDVNRDGSLTEDELGSRSAPRATARTMTRAFEAGRDMGLTDGRKAGREDGRRGTWDLEGQRELEQADAGYRTELGPREQYQAGYREGFRQGYAEAFGPRR